MVSTSHNRAICAISGRVFVMTVPRVTSEMNNAIATKTIGLFIFNFFLAPSLRKKECKSLHETDETASEKR